MDPIRYRAISIQGPEFVTSRRHRLPVLRWPGGLVAGAPVVDAPVIGAPVVGGRWSGSVLPIRTGLRVDTVDGMPSVPAVLSWLRGRSDEQLLGLLRARPDLTVPAPSDLEVLGRRLDNPTSVHRAMEGLNAFDISVLTALALDFGHLGPVPRATVIRLLGPDARPEAVEESFATLQALALIRGGGGAGAGGGGYSIPASVVDILGPYPAGLGPPSGADDHQLRAALVAIDDRSRGVLEALNRSSPRGSCPPEAPAAPVVSGLVKAGLLVRLDAVTVEMPREVGLALRGDSPLGPIPTPPSLPAKKGDIARVDSTAAGQALASLRLLSGLIADVGRSPCPSLKSGGLGVRELRRLAREFGVEEHRVALGLELLAAGGMISTESRGGNNSWQPTTVADEFLAGTDEAAWAQIAGIWLDLRRDPSRAGRRDEAARVTNVLAPDLSWTRGPADRRFVLRALAELPAGAGLGGDDLAQYLSWRAPMRSAERRAALQGSTMTEGTWLGVIAFDALTTAGRALLAGDVPAAATAVAAVDKVLVQADLTVVAPGRLDPLLAARLEQVATVESSGSATVYRVTPQSVRRALDAGLSSADLHSLFDQHSTTGVPQALTYLIDDAARRHGVLRIGGAGSYLRSDDPALVAQAVAAARAAGFVVRRIAPTVAVGPAALPDLLEALAAAGIGVTAEDAGGAVLDVRAKQWRTRPSVPVHQRWREPPVPSEEQLTALVTRMRSADDARGADGRRQISATESVAILKEAVTNRHSAWIGYVDTEGTTTRRMIEPVVVSGGMVVAYDRIRGSMRTFALHRVTDVAIDPDSARTMVSTTDADDRWPAQGLDP